MNLEYLIFVKPLIVSFWLAVVLSLLGIFLLLKRMSFFSDGMAHSAIFGLALAFIFNFNYLLITIFTTSLFAILIFYLERKTKIHSDTLIGIIFVTTLSLGLIIVSQKPGYQPELLNLITGNVLFITDEELILTVIFSLAILTFFLFNWQKIFLTILDPIEARLKKINVTFYELLFYLLLTISIVLGIKLIGVILLTAFLILPSATASLISSSFKKFLLLTILISLITVISGFILGTSYNWPIGASIVVFGSFLFFIFFLLKSVLNINR